MEFDNLQFNKKDRFAVTDPETQISAAEWNALGKKVREMDTEMENIEVTGEISEDFVNGLF